MTDHEPPPDSKLTRSKQRWANERKAIGKGTAQSPDGRLPPGQHLARDWPVLDLGRTPDVPLERWRLRISGMVDRPLTLDWVSFQKLPQIRARSDIHCVTTWSRYDNDWSGVATVDLLAAAEPRDEAAFVLLHGYDGYTTNVPLADFTARGALIAHGWEGKPLSREHGGPARLVIPHLYFWKSAKWITGIELVGVDRPGFWEANGYHMRGDPLMEERYS